METIKRNILLNPGPATTSDTVKQAMVVPDICPRETEFCDIMNSIKLDLPKVVNGQDDYVAVLFASSGTGGVESAITSAVPKDGKMLIVENGSYGTRMCKIAERYSIPYISYSIAYGDYPDVKAIELLIKNDKSITHLAVIDHETTTGMRNPVQAICDLAHKYNIEVIVDCMSSYAGLEIDLQQWKAEYIISSSNKCIQGMAGLSFVIFKKSLLDKIKGNARSFYFDLYEQYSGFQKSGQMQFTPPVQVVYALRKAMDEFFVETLPGRRARYRQNYESLYNGLENLGFRFLLPEAQQSGILLAILEPKNPEYNFDVMHDFLYHRNFTIYPGKGAKEATFRLSVLGDLHKSDIEGFLSTLSDYLVEVRINKLVY
ncbi:MAG: 2-aminoethylphosphonate--pyruvate transaminase [Bacteroidales bacterium]|nr:2-aminoethylphosphonate--pyruvate transaminase [Bacteroidales bacterium]